MPWKTFWLDPTDREVRGLRRYTRQRHVEGKALEWTCAAGWHQAVEYLPGDFPAEVDDDNVHEGEWPAGSHVADDDPRWPAECAKGCGYRFGDGDARQGWSLLLWRRADTGELRVLHQGDLLPSGHAPAAEAGAMWDAKWMGRPGPDGVCLMVRCPCPGGQPGMNDWPVDWPPSGGGDPWDRSGDPRQANVTARPSIAIGLPGRPGFYHGWLTDGVLSDHLG